ncbi:ATP-binding cassette domain-containing protein [Nonomuraea rubra]|uniref:ATP-binding cassette domain-containing protein n=1 Tax=Nonomuraea rubra TaxID=46180 RepID=UPI003617F70B
MSEAVGSTSDPGKTGHVLSMRGIGKSFLGVRVLSGVDLEVAAGEVHAVVGENGAGKSTLMKIICGVHAPDEGTIELDGRPVAFGHPLQAQRSGIMIIHQEFNLLPERTVAENVFLGREPVRRGLVDRAAMEKATARLLDELGESTFGPRDTVKRLPVAQQQIVEIVKALSVNARLLVMDEPSAALAEHEVELLYRLIGRLRTAASPSCTSPTDYARCSTSPTGSPCSRTARASPRSRSAR